MEHYYTIEQPSFAEFKDRGSKFLAFAYPIKTTADFKKHLQDLKKEHPKAVHHCFAYRLGFTGDEFRSSDDGEPSGSAGKPILGQIDSKKLCNVAVIVVRYFGGSLLGVPGLINAYKTASVLALQMVPIIQKPITIQLKIEFDYQLINDVMIIVKQCQCNVISQEINLFSNLTLEVPKSREKEVVFRLGDIKNLIILPEKTKKAK
jgi:uncharacterized YigZ family protein